MTKEKLLKAITEDLEQKEIEFKDMVDSRAVGVETLAYQKGYLDCLRNIKTL